MSSSISQKVNKKMKHFGGRIKNNRSMGKKLEQVKLKYNKNGKLTYTSKRQLGNK